MKFFENQYTGSIAAFWLMQRQIQGLTIPLKDAMIRGIHRSQIPKLTGSLECKPVDDSEYTIISNLELVSINNVALIAQNNKCSFTKFINVSHKNSYQQVLDRSYNSLCDSRNKIWVLDSTFIDPKLYNSGEFREIALRYLKKVKDTRLETYVVLITPVARKTSGVDDITDDIMLENLTIKTCIDRNVYREQLIKLEIPVE